MNKFVSQEETMRYRVCLPILFFCAFAAPAEPAESGPLPVAKIIAAYAQASGGQALAEIKSEVRKGTLMRGATGQVPLVIMAKAPGSWMYNQAFAWGDQICYGFDGTEAWVQDTRSIGPMSPRQLLDMRLLFDVQAPLKLGEFFTEMTGKGSEKVGTRDASTIRARTRDGLETELAFDRETGLLLRAGSIYFEDYRSVGKVRRPFRILLGSDEGEKHLQMKMQFSEINHNPDMDDALFRRPLCALPFKASTIYKSRKRVDVGSQAMDACVGVYREVGDPNVTFTVTRQQNHLMIASSGRLQRLEIKPESEVDYFIGFLEWEFHFIKDAAGRVTNLVIKANREIKTEKI
jgi:hypothetical protein